MAHFYQSQKNTTNWDIALSEQCTPMPFKWGGRVVRWCWVRFQCRGVLLIWNRVGQGPTVLAVGADGVVWTFFLLSFISLFLSPCLWETARYRLKYCLRGPFKPKQPTNQSICTHWSIAALLKLNRYRKYFKCPNF